ncbi:MAG: rod shape-determining protein MreC [Candidatus Sulfotelmatobacter sp.]
MESFLGRYRNLTILVGVLFLQVLGLAVQVKRSGDAENTRLIRVWAVRAITPFERALVWGQNGTSDLWHNYFFLRGVRAENRRLNKEIEEMRLQEVRMKEDAAQAHRLQSLLAFKEQFIVKPLAAQVIGSSGSDLSRSVYIDKGSDEGVAQDMAVITAGGIVGKVLHAYPSTSLVLMINDQSSGVGAMLEKSRLQGVVRGTPNGELVMERVMSDEQVSPGETVLSSGGDQIFPKGLPLGTVSKVSPGREMFLNIHVKPAADLSRIEEVLVVTEKQERAPVAESGGRVRAADILAQRLPSVPEKPAVVAGPSAPAANVPGGAAEPGSTAGVKPPPNAAVKPLTGTGTTVEVLKKVAQMPAGGNSGTKTASSSGAASSAVLSPTTNASSKVTPKSAATTAKPAAAPPKSSNSPSNPKPAATEDNPH